MMSFVGGKCISCGDDPIGLDSKVKYTDQNGISCFIDMNKFYNLAKKSKDDYFKSWIHWLKDKDLTIGAFIISGLDKLAREFPNEVNNILAVEE